MEKSTEKHNLFNCEKCAFSCDRKPDWKRHLGTGKHIKLISVNESLIQNTQQFICGICSKEYKSNVGLWKHKKTCVIVPPIPPTQIISEDNTIIKILIDDNK